jgi:hypothetical protein
MSTNRFRRQGRVAGFIADEGAYKHHFSNMKFYSVTGPSVAYRTRLFAGLEKAVALDYCSGNGEVGWPWPRAAPGRSSGST